MNKPIQLNTAQAKAINDLKAINTLIANPSHIIWELLAPDAATYKLIEQASEAIAALPIID